MPSERQHALPGHDWRTRDPRRSAGVIAEEIDTVLSDLVVDAVEIAMLSPVAIEFVLAVIAGIPVIASAAAVAEARSGQKSQASDLSERAQRLRAERRRWMLPASDFCAVN